MHWIAPVNNLNRLFPGCYLWMTVENLLRKSELFCSPAWGMLLSPKRAETRERRGLLEGRWGHGPSWGAQDLVEGGPPSAGVPVPALDGVLDTFYVYLYLRLGWCTCTHVHWLMCREGSCRKLDPQSMVNVLIMINPLVAPVVGIFIDVSRRAEFASLLRLGYVSPGALK